MEVSFGRTNGHCDGKHIWWLHRNTFHFTPGQSCFIACDSFLHGEGQGLQPVPRHFHLSCTRPGRVMSPVNKREENVAKKKKMQPGVPNLYQKLVNGPQLVAGLRVRQAFQTLETSQCLTTIRIQDTVHSTSMVALYFNVCCMFTIY